MRISDSDQARVRGAIGQAEHGTGADFVCVLMKNAARYETYALAWAAFVALLAPWGLLLTTHWTFATILLAQLIVFAVVLLALSWPPLLRRLVTRKVQRAAAHRAAAEQFVIRGLTRTPDRRGILLFVAHDERYARVLADDGVAQHVIQEHWDEAVALLVKAAREGRHADGFVDALAHCNRVLTRQLPPDHSNANDLPDKFHVMV